MTEVLTAEMIRTAGDLWRQTGRTFTATFGGSSMEPTIRAGEPLIVQCGTPFSSDDVVMFFRLDRMVVHRVVAANAEVVMTAGDGHRLPDPFLTPRASVVGRVLAVKRDGGDVPPSPGHLRASVRLSLFGFRLVFACMPQAAARLARVLSRATAALTRREPA